MVGLIVGACSSDDSPSGGADPDAGTGGRSSGDGGDATGGKGTGGARNTGGATPTEAGTTLKLNWSVIDTSGVELGTVSADAGSPDAGGSGDAGPDPGGSTADAGATPPAFPPLPGVKVCVQEHPEIDCVTTGADGAFTLTGLPTGSDLLVELTKDGYTSVLRPIETAEIDMDGPSPIIMSLAPVQTDGGGDGILPPLDTAKGSVSFFAYSLDTATLLTTTKVTLSPAEGDGPYFLNPSGQFVTGAVTLQGSLGYFFNVPPGIYTLTFEDPTADCAPVSTGFGSNGYPVPPHSVRFPIQAGHITDQIGVYCSAP